MTSFKTILVATSMLAASVSTAQADGHSNGVTVISDLISVPEIGPDVVTIALVGGLLVLLSSASATTTSN